MNAIIHNRIRCKKCGEIIESHTVHEFKWCSCGAVAVDGGRITCAAVGTEKTMRTYRKSAYRANKIEMSLIFDKKIKLIFFYIL